jgi:ATP-binding cassette subfamily F protein 3
MIRLKNVSIYRGSKRVLHEVNVSLYAGQRVGVVGANGAGKSSLFAALAGRVSCDGGEIEIPPGTRLAEVEQHAHGLERPVIDYVLDGWQELRDLEHALRESELAGDGHRQARLLGDYEDLGGYQARAGAARVLAGLGYAAPDHERPLGEFSGGWRVRAALARALMRPSDLLLLDEPTNHLDLDAIVWLEDWLGRYPGTALVISHDREFLNHVVKRILHVGSGRATAYTGNYDEFERARAEALAQEQRAYERQQQEVARIHRFVERFRYKATKARQAQSRLKTLQRMELLAPAHVDSPFRFGLPQPERMPNPLVTLTDAVADYGSGAVLRDVGVSLREGMRIGLLGRNGAGKSTFVRLLTGELVPATGVRAAAPDLVVGYFAQHGIEQLRDDEDALVQFLRVRPGMREQQGRDVLGRYGFQAEDVLRPVSSFSGGERARLVLAMIFEQRPNLLLLDEPTNHLDLEMRHALSVALQEFRGALVLVSHDRHLLASICDELWLVRDGLVGPFDGDLDDYARWLRRGGDLPEARASGGSAPPAAAATATAAAPQRQRKLSYREQRELDGLPAAIEAMECELADLQRQLGDPEFLRGGGERIAHASRALADKEFDLARAYSRWGELEGDG